MRTVVRAGLVLGLGLWLAGVAAGQEALSKRDASGPLAVTARTPGGTEVRPLGVEQATGGATTGRPS